MRQSINAQRPRRGDTGVMASKMAWFSHRPRNWLKLGPPKNSGVRSPSSNEMTRNGGYTPFLELDGFSTDSKFCAKKNQWWLVVWNIFYFSIYWEYSSSQLTHIFQRGWLKPPTRYGFWFSKQAATFWFSSFALRRGLHEEAELKRCWSFADLDSPLGFVWKCWVYSQWNSHLIGIMISKTIGCRGVHNIFRHTHLEDHPRNPKWLPSGYD